MILVDKVSVLKTEKDFYTIAHFSGVPKALRTSDIFDSYEESQITKEHIRGRRFVNKYGEEVVIGWSKDVEDTLGLPFEVFDNYRSSYELEKALESLKTTIKSSLAANDILRSRIDIVKIHRDNILKRFYSLNFWQRLKFLFFKTFTD